MSNSMPTIHAILVVIANVVGFYILRYLSIIHLFLRGIGPDAKYSIWDYVPAYGLQLLVLTLLASKTRWRISALISIAAITALFLGSHFRFIPYWIIPY